MITNDTILVVVGTRPDAIKLLPVYFALVRRGYRVFLCATFQHDTLLQQVLDLFNVTPFVRFDIMKEGQDLFYLTNQVLEKCKNLFFSLKPQLVIVQGDTTTSFCAALAAFYFRIPVAHVEAGLRTYNLYAPFPEEANRKLITALSALHFAPTLANVDALHKEYVDPNTVFCVGNTGIDSLYAMEQQLASGSVKPSAKLEQLIVRIKNNKNKLVLMTVHRREVFGKPIREIFGAIKLFLQQHNDVEIIFPVHPNPEVIGALHESLLSEQERCHAINPLAYHEMVYVLSLCDWVVTDSGGLQEEAASFGKRILVLRQRTERIEGVASGIARVCGIDAENLVVNLKDFYLHADIQHARSTLYGSGKSSEHIVDIITEHMFKKNWLNDKRVVNNCV